jgi:hypothetical protein
MSEQSALVYASPGTIAPTPRIDLSALAFAGVQVACFVFLLTLDLFADSGANGHHELRGGTWFERLAYQYSAWVMPAWILASLLGVCGALWPPGRRARWYVAYVLIIVATVVLKLIALAAIDHAGMSTRWVSPVLGPQPWQGISIDEAHYVGTVVVTTIANPLVILLGFRALTQKRKDGVAADVATI